MYTLAEISISYKPLVKLSGLPKISSSKDAERILRSSWSDSINHREEFAILLLNRGNKVLGFSKISSGGVAGTVADPKIIFQTALKGNASAIILCHNHPSGNLKPSLADIALTNKLKSAGELMDLSVLDHVILTDEAYFSFADECMM